MRKLMLIIPVLLSWICSFAQPTKKTDDFDAIRLKWFAFLTNNTQGAVFDNNGGSSLWRTLHKGSQINTLWDDLDYKYSKDISTSYRRLHQLSRAYATSASPLYHNVSLRNDIEGALRWLHEHKYNPHVPPPEAVKGSNIINWWDFQIGTPLELNNILVLLYDEIAEAERLKYLNTVAYYVRDFKERYVTVDSNKTFTGANRVWISTVMALQGILTKDASKIRYASDSLSPVFQYVTAGDGFYQDGSFIQHAKFSYTGGYGVSLLITLAEELYLLRGSQWEVKDPSMKNVFRWVYDSYAPIIYKGQLMSMTMGREISRHDTEEPKKAMLAIQAVALLSECAPPPDKLKLQQLVKRWVIEGYFKNFQSKYTAYIQPILESSSIVADTSYNFGYKQFSNMDRAVQLSPRYAFAISMHSLRTFNYETRTGYENIKGWHTGDGQTHLYTSDRSQFSDDFWPTVNFFRLPGTTVIENSKVPGYKHNKSAWVGGASLLNRFGVSGMDFKPTGQDLMARKSWFMLDGKVFAMGAGISTSGKQNVHTYIEQRKLLKDNSNRFIINGKVFSVGEVHGTKQSENVSWAHLSGSTEGAGIGYYFPVKASLNIERSLQKGSWKDLNVNQKQDIKSHNYLSFWVDHGASPIKETKSTYSYVLLPGFTQEQTSQYASHPDVMILENSPTIQAVIDHKSNLVAANFWEDRYAALSVNGVSDYLSCSTKASVILKKEKGKLYLALSDPTMLNQGTIEIKIKEPVLATGVAIPEIEIINREKEVLVKLKTTNFKGKSAEIIFDLDNEKGGESK